MKLLLERIYNCSTYCIGHLYKVDENGNREYICDTIEDMDRGLDDSMTVEHIKAKKLYGITAIPCGEYKITQYVKSPKFSKKAFYKNLCDGYLPRLLNVKGFESILLHCREYC